MMNYYDIKEGLRVITAQGFHGEIVLVGTGSAHNAILVKLDTGRTVIERGHTLKREE